MLVVSAPVALPKSASLVPIVLATVQGLAAQAISTRILTSSIKSRLKTCSPTAIREARHLLEQEIGAKRKALKQQFPLAAMTMTIGAWTSWWNPTNQGWHLYAPTWLVIGVEASFLFFFGALDNIQDEVLPLGKPHFLELATLTLGSVATLLVLLRANKVYLVKAVSIIFGTTIANTNDTRFWRLLGPVALLLSATSAFLPTWEAGPSARIVIFNIAAACLTSLAYEKLTQEGNPIKAPQWLVNQAQAGMLHYFSMSVMIQLGLFPLGWLPREILYSFLYYWSKLFQHYQCLELLPDVGAPAGEKEVSAKIRACRS